MTTRSDERQDTGQKSGPDQHTESGETMGHSTKDWPQSQYDSTFAGMSPGFFAGQPVDYQREYFSAVQAQVRQLEDVVHTARRISEIAAIAQIQGQIVGQVAAAVRQQVIRDLTTDPMLRQQLLGPSS